MLQEGEHATYETVKATVTVAGTDIGKNSCRVVGLDRTGSGVGQAYFERGYELESRRTRSRTICDAKGLMFPARGIAALPKKLASIV